MRKILILFSLASSSWNLFAEGPELKGSPAELSQYLGGLPKTVVIAGEAEVRVPADQAIVSLKVTTENKSLQEALRSNQESRSKLLTHLKNNGIPGERVHASRFSSTPKFGWLSDKAKSYRVENVVKVTVQDEQELQAAASAVDGFATVQFVGAEFEHKDKESWKAKAIAQACDNANQRRKVFEEKFGFTLKPEKFSGGTVLQNRNAAAFFRNMAADSGSFSRKSPSSAGPANEATSLAQAEEDVSAFGELVYTVEVSIEYSVQPK